MGRNTLKFNYKIVHIDYIRSNITINYWCEGMTFYNGLKENLDFNIEVIKYMSEEEFDKHLYENVKVNFKNLLTKYEDYKNGKYNLLENISKSARSINVV
tara:strand:- start:907 stop:1206 length:300 start_codon:yes stop_codon:yes gene_type:complete